MGATLGCYVKGCSQNYHYLCAVKAGEQMRRTLCSSSSSEDYSHVSLAVLSTSRLTLHSIHKIAIRSLFLLGLHCAVIARGFRSLFLYGLHCAVVARGICFLFLLGLHCAVIARGFRSLF